jgi:hypothetical protein
MDGMEWMNGWMDGKGRGGRIGFLLAFPFFIYIYIYLFNNKKYI